MARKKRRKFTPEQKAQAVRIVRESGKTLRQVAQEIDIPQSSLSRWVSQAKVDDRQDSLGPLTSEERAELVQTRKELRRVRMERDFLKKAAAFFARENS